MENWLPDKSDLKRPRYRSLMEAIEEAIDKGLLKPGDRLPTHRDLSFRLGLSVQTVSHAYTRLIEAGHIVGEVGRGSYVRSSAGAGMLPFPDKRAGPMTTDLALLKPVVTDRHRVALQAALQGVAKDLPDELFSSFRPATIVERHADSVDDWLDLCGVPTRDRAVITTNGSTSAMTVALMSVAHSGDLIVTESMGHHTLPILCRSLGLRLKGLAMDAEGILPDALDHICASEVVKAVFLMPRTGPLCSVMGEDRRHDIVDVARRHDIAIIENDAWGPLRSSALPSLAALAPERCHHFTGLTKCLMPGLRIGFLTVPQTAASIARERHLVTNWMVTPLIHEIATRWMADGTAQALCDWQHKALNRRADVALDILGASGLRVTRGGLAAWLPCPDVGSEARLVEQARAAGILLAPGSTFSIGPLPATPGVRISLGAGEPEAFANALTVLRGIAAENAAL